MKATIARKVTTSGRIAIFNERNRGLFHRFDAESTSVALRRTIKHNTVVTLTFATPIGLNALIADVALRADVAISDVVLNIESIWNSFLLP